MGGGGVRPPLFALSRSLSLSAVENRANVGRVLSRQAEHSHGLRLLCLRRFSRLVLSSARSRRLPNVVGVDAVDQHKTVARRTDPSCPAGCAPVGGNDRALVQHRTNVRPFWAATGVFVSLPGPLGGWILADRTALGRVCARIRDGVGPATDPRAVGGGLRDENSLCRDFLQSARGACPVSLEFTAGQERVLHLVGPGTFDGEVGWLAV